MISNFKSNNESHEKRQQKFSSIVAIVTSSFLSHICLLGLRVVTLEARSHHIWR